MKPLFYFILFSSLLLAKPFSPQNLDSIIFSIEQNTESKKISELLKSIQKKPTNLNLVNELLTFYIRLGKHQSDTSYIGYAKAFLAPYLTKYPNSYSLKMHQVDILQYTHKFDEALVLLKQITTKVVDKPKPYLLMAIIYQAKEDYSTSLIACKKLIFRSSHLLTATCLSLTQSYLGKLEPSYALLEDVYSKAKKEDLSEKSWALSSLSNMAYRLGKKEKALLYLKEALSFDENDYFILKKMADIYLEQEKYEEVKSLLEEYIYVDSLFLRLTVAKEKLGMDVILAKENLNSFVKNVKLRNEKLHKEDISYFKMLGIK